eukprot:11066895-Alexandrium_andersonii.AAC.1
MVMVQQQPLTNSRLNRLSQRLSLQSRRNPGPQCRSTLMSLMAACSAACSGRISGSTRASPSTSIDKAGRCVRAEHCELQTHVNARCGTYAVYRMQCCASCGTRAACHLALATCVGGSTVSGGVRSQSHVKATASPPLM